MFPSRSPRPLFWQLHIGWLLMMPIGTTVASLAYDDWGNVVLTGAVRQVIGFFMTLALWHFYGRWPAETFRLAPHIAQIALACLAVTAVDALLVDAIRRIFDLPPALTLAERGAVPVRFSLYCAWSAFYFVIRQEAESHDRELRIARAETAARDAELSTLRAQVNPHFLFNALTSILAECDVNPRAAGAITRSLADYLRASLLQRDHRAPLGEEVDAITGYLRVEQARFEERLVVSFSIEEAARAAVVPTAVLLPLVENAVKYGMRTSPPPLRIAVSAAVHEGLVTVAVENSGHWIEPKPDVFDSTRIGLENLRRRLSLLYDGRAGLTIQHNAQQVRVTVNLPVGESCTSRRRREVAFRTEELVGSH